MDLVIDDLVLSFVLELTSSALSSYSGIIVDTVVVLEARVLEYVVITSHYMADLSLRIIHL